MCHYKSMRMKTSQACKYLGVARHTLYKMIEDGMPAHRSIGGHYMFDQEEMDQYIGKAPALPERMAVGYCRVSTKKRKDDLERQADVVEIYMQKQGWKYQIIEDTGSGMNYKKPGLLKLIDLLLDRKISYIVITHKDRLLRFGFELIEYIAKKMDTEIVVLNQGEERNSAQELTDDLIAIITVFSGRLYGSRSNKTKKIIEESKRLLKGDGADEQIEENDSDGFNQIE